MIPKTRCTTILARQEVGKNVDSFCFHYWDVRLTPKIVEDNPLAEAITRTKEVLVGDYVVK